jgi:hypothetical protein
MELIEILYSIGYTKVHDYGRQYSMRPLYRDSDNDKALTVNKDTGEWYDFVERVGGPIESLIERTIGGPATPEILAQIASDTFLPARKQEIELTHQKTFDKELLVKLLNDHSYWHGRKVSNRVIEKFKGGVATNGRMTNRYVFPIFNSRDELVGFSGRYIYKSQHAAKWKHLGKKSSWIFPLIHEETILKNKEAILVESIGDMLSMEEAGFENVLVTFGVKISTDLITYLLKMDVNKVYLALNNDKNNNYVGNKAAQDGKDSLCNYFDPSQVIIALPEVKNDFGEMTRDEIISWKLKLNQK